MSDASNKPGGEYAALLAELDTFSKSMAADAGGDGDGEGDGDGDGEGEGLDADGNPKKKPDATDADGDTFGKAMMVTLDDGQKVEAYDGTAMMKALHTQNQELQGRVLVVAEQNELLLKALTVSKTAMESLRARVDASSALVKSLQDEVTRLGGKGAGRRAVVNVHEKPAAGGGDGGQKMSPDEFMNKAMGLFDARKMTGIEIARLEAHLQRGTEPPSDLVAKVLAG